MSRLARSTWTAAVSLSLFIVAACGSMGGRSGEPAAQIIVDNEHGPLGTVQVWLVPEVGPRNLLGNVGSAQVDTLELNVPPTGGEYQLRAEPATGGQIVSRPFRFLAGQTVVRWDLGQNSIFVTRPE